MITIVTDLDTAIAGVTLRPLTVADAAAYHAALQVNRAHLTQFGNYVEETSQSLDAVRRALALDDPLRFAILDGTQLAGRIDLVPVDPPRYGLGFWLVEQATGRGIATAAVRAVTTHAHADLGATDVFAGVTLGNEPSVAVLRRAGFAPVTEFATYTRFHLPLTA